MKIRESNYDLLRILACIAVIGIHASATYINMLYDNDFLGGWTIMFLLLYFLTL